MHCEFCICPGDRLYNVTGRVLKKVLSEKHALGCVWCRGGQVCLRKEREKEEWGGQKILGHFGMASTWFLY